MTLGITRQAGSEQALGGCSFLLLLQCSLVSMLPRMYAPQHFVDTGCFDGKEQCCHYQVLQLLDQNGHEWVTPSVRVRSILRI